MTATTDRDLVVQTAVTDELGWMPDVNAAHVGVAVNDGIVTLSGEVSSIPERLAARRAALRIRGVRAFVDDMTVHPTGPWPITQADVAKAVEHSLTSATDVPDTVKAEVDGCDVTLIGEVDWDFQRTAAERAVQYLRGVNTVANRITLKNRPSASDTEERIASAFARSAQLDAKSIHAHVDGTRVTLTGTVGSWAERQQAGKVAWSAPHVTVVDNQIHVRGL